MKNEKCRLYYPFKQSSKMGARVLHKEILFFIFISRSRTVKDKVLAFHYALFVCVCVSARACVCTVHGRYNVQLMMLSAGQTIQYSM